MLARAPLQSEAALSLALAVVASSTTPQLLLDGELNVLAASTTFYSLFELAPESVAGRPLAAVGGGEWAAPELGDLLMATRSGAVETAATEMNLERHERASRRLVLNARKLDYGDIDNTRLLLSVIDVTDARAAEKLKDDLLREKAVLLQEVQHRVANSLQIIASVLLQSARRVHSDETRRHLYDAHQRVMSVAAVQRQLAVSRLGDVELRPYFVDLCESISASMIRDHKQLSLVVTADDSVCSANASVSLGLIVTELVINALKHAFPGRRQGKISVDYASVGPAWTLSVGDNGVGMAADPESAKSGLGTSIVEALAKQLHAEVRIAAANPGTSISIVHAA
jgi:two-component system, sensor histidine kinase PdtaS